MRTAVTNKQIIIGAGILIVFFLIVLRVMQVRLFGPAEDDGSGFRYPVRMQHDLDIGSGVEF